jgi:hypothetical protein
MGPPSSVVGKFFFFFVCVVRPENVSFAMYRDDYLRLAPFISIVILLLVIVIFAVPITY